MFSRAGERGLPIAQAVLGSMYISGRGVPRNYVEAVKWFRKAADQGDATAENGLGYAYASGKGVEQDYRESAKWFLAAADQGDADAQYNLGLLYEAGLGVRLDYVVAYKWLAAAEINGSAQSRDVMKVLAKLMTATQLQRAHEQLTAWLQAHPVASETSDSEGPATLEGDYPK